MNTETEMTKICEVGGVILKGGDKFLTDEKTQFYMYDEGIQSEDGGGFTLYGWSRIEKVLPLPEKEALCESCKEELSMVFDAAYSAAMDAASEFAKTLEPLMGEMWQHDDNFFSEQAWDIALGHAVERRYIQVGVVSKDATQEDFDRAADDVVEAQE